MGLVFVPIYISNLGVESYGLIGIFVSLQAWLGMLDMGMSATLNREMARFSAGEHTAQSIRNLLRSVEVVYIAIVLLISTIVWRAAPWIASDWLNVQKLPLDAVINAMQITGLVVALRMMEGLYRGVLQGLQLQVWFNGANSILATLRWGGAAIAVWHTPTIVMFFYWQMFASFLGTIVLAVKVYSNLPVARNGGAFQVDELLKVWRFSGGLIAITFLALLLTQVDKILLSKLLSLEAFGLYTLATTLVSALYMLVYPISNAFYPQFVQLHAQDNKEMIADSYHKGCQLISLLVIPPAVVLAFFSEPVLRLWTQNADTAVRVAPIVVPLILGTLFNGLMTLPYMMQLAYGWTGLTIRVNIVAVSILIPALLTVVPKYGPVGAAYLWLFLNVGYVFIAVHFMHLRILPHEKWRWYIDDIVIPLAAAVAAASVMRAVLPVATSVWGEVGCLSVAGVFVFMTTGIVIKTIRELVFQRFQLFYRQ